jgi:hypothetical protein
MAQGDASVREFFHDSVEGPSIPLCDETLVHERVEIPIAVVLPKKLLEIPRRALCGLCESRFLTRSLSRCQGAPPSSHDSHSVAAADFQFNGAMGS